MDRGKAISQYMENRSRIAGLKYANLCIIRDLMNDGMTQHEIADEVGLSRQYIGKLIRDTMDRRFTLKDEDES